MSNYNFKPLPKSFEYLGSLDDELENVKDYKDIIYSNIKQLLKDDDYIINYSIKFERNKLNDVIIKFNCICKSKNIDRLINNIETYFEYQTPFKFSKNIKYVEHQTGYKVKIERYELVD